MKTISYIILAFDLFSDVVSSLAGKLKEAWGWSPAKKCRCVYCRMARRQLTLEEHLIIASEKDMDGLGYD
jgi:hypothetical protein